jgi:hypothetical protein
MFGSTFAVWISSFFNQPTDRIQIPQEKVINFELSQEQKTYLMRRGYTLIEYRYASGCLECIDMRRNLQRITMTSDEQIYLQEIVSSGTDKVNVISLNGQKTATNPNINETKEMVCDLIMQRPIWCVTGQL